MDNPVVVALIISGIGMTLLFLSLALFYVLLVLLTRLFPERKQADVTQRTDTVRGRASFEAAPSAKLKAAAIAVALARAEAELERTGRGGATEREIADTGHVSPWWRLHHQRQMGSHMSHRRRP